MAKAIPTSPAQGEVKQDFYPGRIRRVNAFWIDANQSLELAQRFIPWLSRFIMTMSAIAVISLLISLFSLWLRPDPLVLLSFPDGTNHCAPASLNPATGALRKRPDSQTQTCALLDASNRGVQEQ
jgi:hypothetical protein